MTYEVAGLIQSLRQLVANPIVSFIAGIFGGIFIHAVSELYVIEPWKHHRDQRRRTSEQAQRQMLARRLSERLSARLFSFAGVTTRIYVLDLNIEGYEPRAIVSRQVPFKDEVPDQYRIQYANFRLKWDALQKTGKIFDGAKCVTPRKVSIDRLGNTEEKSIRFDFSISQGYAHDRTVCDVFRSLDEPVRKKLVSEPSTTMDPFFSTGFGVMLAVVTSDGLLTFARRSSSSAINTSKIICSVAELTTELDVRQKHFDIYETSRRALAEELGINLQANELQAIEITACIFDTEYHEWTMIGHVDLRNVEGQYTSDVLLEYKATAKGHDAWEVADLHFIEFSPSSVAGYIQAHADEIVDMSKVVAIIALLSVLRDRSGVAEAFRLFQESANES